MHRALLLLPLMLAACATVAPVGRAEVGRAQLMERATDNLLAFGSGNPTYALDAQTAPCVVAAATDAELQMLAAGGGAVPPTLRSLLQRGPASSCLQGGAL